MTTEVVVPVPARRGGAARRPALPVASPAGGAVRPALPPAGVPLRRPVHPGRFLNRMFLVPLGISQSEAARCLGVSRRRLHEVVQGRRAITPDTAIRCALHFGADAAFWLALQSAWDSFQAWERMKADGVTAPLPRGLDGRARAGLPRGDGMTRAALPPALAPVPAR
ncbi:HigA family addiction module antitoxin [Derxia gummosa]|uniref:HigA family addiction module antitoxin n=1 Tax=Derxia gummosa DSM 723 TaxID=1121388 RepID=A0A8B6X9J7_9BURK|nr:HigA family addiction module antitoxin [Derxia gummosa]